MLGVWGWQRRTSILTCVSQVRLAVSLGGLLSAWFLFLLNHWTLVLWEADRLGAVLQESIYDVGRRQSWWGWALTYRMSGESRISTAITSERARLGHQNTSPDLSFLHIWIKHGGLTSWVCEGGGLPFPLPTKPSPLLLHILETVWWPPSGLFSGCAPVTPRSCWFLCGSQIKSWRTWLPSALGSASLWLYIGETVWGGKLL
jgi:hypothetical protein